MKNNLFKTSSISYSRFLQSKTPPVHQLTDARECVDIDFFKRSIAVHYQHIYASKKRLNWFYRFVFFGIGLLFLILASIIFFKTVNFACALYFKNCMLVKNGVNAVCLLLASTSFAIGCKIHPEGEAIQYLIGKVERELRDPTKQVQIEFNAIISNLARQMESPHQAIWINKALSP